MVLNKLITSFNNLFGISHWEENKKENDLESKFTEVITQFIKQKEE